MDHKRVLTTIEMIRKTYRGILDEPSSQALDNAKTKLNSTSQSYIRKQAKEWGYEIYDSAPLRFRMSPIGKLKLIVDVYCNVKWAEGDAPVKQDIKMRIWSKHEALTFRPQLDAAELQDVIKTSKYGRVMSRIHFDKVNHSDSNNVSDQYHPNFHVQIGGKSVANEICWHPDSLDIPRIPHYPLELFLICQIVAANFFPKAYEEIRRKREWREELIMYQERIILPYFLKSIDILKNKSVYLDELQKSNSMNY